MHLLTRTFFLSCKTIRQNDFSTKMGIATENTHYLSSGVVFELPCGHRREKSAVIGLPRDQSLRNPHGAGGKPRYEDRETCSRTPLLYRVPLAGSQTTYIILYIYPTARVYCTTDTVRFFAPLRPMPRACGTHALFAGENARAQLSVANSVLPAVTLVFF